MSCLGAPCHARGCAHARSHARRCAPPRPALLPVDRGHPSFVVGTLRGASSARNTTRARPDAMCELGQVADLFGHLGAAHLRQCSQLASGLGTFQCALGPFPGEALLWAERPVCSTSGPKGPRRRLRRRVPVNPGRGAGDAARETAAQRAVARAAADLPPRLPPEACGPGAALRADAAPRDAPGPAHAGS